MELIVALLSLGFVIFIHELGHAFAFRAKGIKLDTIAIGFGKKTWPHLSFSVPYFGPQAVFRIHPIIIGGYVTPVEGFEEKMKDLPYHDKTMIYGAGIVANLMLGVVMVSLYQNFVVGSDNAHLFLVRDALVVALIYFGRQLIASYLIPVVGIPFLCFVAYLTFTTPIEQQGGPVAIVRQAVDEGFKKNLYFFGLTSFSLAIINALPLSMLDGGRIMRSVIQKLIPSLENFYLVSTSILLALLIIWALLSDAINVFF